MTTAQQAPTSSPSTSTSSERTDLVESLQRHRGFLLQTVQGISDEQARARSTVSALTLGSLVKHVAQTEKHWAEFVLAGPGDAPDIDWTNVDWSNPPPEVVAFQQGHTMLENETLAGLLEQYAAVAATTDVLVATLDLDSRQPLPQAPWFEAGATWSARRVILHIVAETSQHAGHADIIREAIDGQRTMG